MKIDYKSYNNFLDILAESKEKGRELGSFGLYLPSEDRILTSISLDELPADTIEKSNKNQLKYNQDLLDLISAFNQGTTEYFNLAQHQFNQKDGKIFSYHTHPISEQDMVPSKYDRSELINMASPLELVISAQAQKYWPKTPFVAGYHQDYFPENKKDFSKITFNEINSTAKRMCIPESAIWELAYLNYHTGLYPVIDFEIEKPKSDLIKK